MTELSTVLPIILYIFGIILVIVLIMLGLRMLQMMDRVDRILDDVEGKVKTLDGLFNVINKVTTGIDLISTKFVSNLANTVGKIWKKSKKEEESNE